MRSFLIPIALAVALVAGALSPADALAQQPINSMRPSYYTPSNYGTPNASAFRPSNFGNPGVSYSMPNPYRYMPSYSTLNSGTPTPIGVVHTLPGTVITGVNFGAPPGANQPLPADGSPITVNVPQPSAAALNALAPTENPAATPAPETLSQAPATSALPTDATTQATYGTLAQGTFVPNALTTPGTAAVTPVAPPSAAPAPSAPALTRVVPLVPTAAMPSYGTFTPAPRYPASFSSALNRVYGSGY
jgi:hypothetical protein